MCALLVYFIGSDAKQLFFFSYDHFFAIQYHHLNHIEITFFFAFPIGASLSVPKSRFTFFSYQNQPTSRQITHCIVNGTHPVFGHSISHQSSWSSCFVYLKEFSKIAKQFRGEMSEACYAFVSYTIM